jgi:hypothetical protein
MTDVSRGEKWHPLFEYNRLLAKEQHPFCFDQAKTNLLFLLEPRIDTEGVGAAKKNPIAEAIHEHMDIVTDEWLRKMPLQFLEKDGRGGKYWTREDVDGDSALTQHCPPDYLRTMAKRAHEAQRYCVNDRKDGP